MKRRVLSLLSVFFLLCGVFSGCGKVAETTTPVATTPVSMLDITLNESVPLAYVDAAYDVTRLYVAQEGVEYSYKANYIDPEDGTTHKLTVKKGVLTPKVNAEITLTITAEKGTVSVSKEVKIPMGVVTDCVDNLLASDGLAGGSVAGVEKKVVTDSNYLKAEGSLSALSVSFANADNGGVEIANLSHYALTEYYNDRTWKNAAVTFWVYNPMDQDVEFKLTSYDPVKIQANYWDSETNTQIGVAKAGQWSLIQFSLYKMGIEQVLFTAPDGLRSDSLKLMARYAGTGTCNLYMDGLDIVPASTVEGLDTGYVNHSLPSGDYSDLLKICSVYTRDSDMTLATSTNGNGTKDAYSFGTNIACGYPTFYVDFAKTTDISGFDYLKFDVYAENAYPHVTAGVCYLDENGEVQRARTSFDYKRNEWRTIYVNLDYLKEADLTKVVGLSFSVHMDSQFVANEFNCVYFDNVSLYTYEEDQPILPAATVEDHDLISGPFYTINTKPGTNGVCKVATDEKGDSKSNSTLLFWTNNASGYPNPVAIFRFEEEQDWSNKQMLSVDTHQDNAHFWMGFTIICLDEDGDEVTYFFRHDTVLTNWMTNSFPLSWFKYLDLNGDSCKPEDLKRVVGLQITVDLAVNVTSEVGQIFFDNISVS